MFVSKFKPEVASPRIINDVSVELVRKHSREASITISNDDFTVEAASRFLGWANLNQNKKVCHQYPTMHAGRNRLHGIHPHFIEFARPAM